MDNKHLVDARSFAKLLVVRKLKTKTNILILITVTTGLFSCKRDSKSTSDRGKHINTKYEYTESTGERLVIQNSFPKSMINYTSPDGKKYIYFIFWTRIINETPTPLEVTIDCPLDSFEIPASSGKFRKLLFPADTMTIDKEPLLNYGLALKSFLDDNLDKSTSVKRTVHPKDSSAFYVVTLALFSRAAPAGISFTGRGGAMRTGFSIKEQNLFYNINGTEVPCGKSNFK